MRLKELRIARGLTQEEVAAALGIQSARYRTWEAGIRSPKLENLVALADYFGCSTDYLLERPTRGVFDDPKEEALHAIYESLDAGHQEMLGEIAVDFQRSEAWSSTTVSDQSRGDVTVVGNGNVVGDNNTVTETGSFDGDQTVTINSYGG